MYAAAPHRMISALAASALVAAGMGMLLFGLGRPTDERQPPHPSLVVITTHRPTVKPPPAVEPKPSRLPERQVKRDAPPALTPRGGAPAVARATPPLPPVVITPPAPAVPLARVDPAPRQGAPDAIGYGDGGAGAGSGGRGLGDGAGSGSRSNPDAARYPQQVAGKLHYWEIPKELRQDKGGVIRLQYRIGADGRVSQCHILQSSGLPQFDRDTCARITDRFRFRPALDRSGRPIPFLMTETHGWDD